MADKRLYEVTVTVNSETDLFIYGTEESVMADAEELAPDLANWDFPAYIVSRPYPALPDDRRHCPVWTGGLDGKWVDDIETWVNAQEPEHEPPDPNQMMFAWGGKAW